MVDGQETSPGSKPRPAQRRVAQWVRDYARLPGIPDEYIGEDGPRSVTIPEQWPLKRIRIQGAEFVRPDLLIR